MTGSDRRIDIDAILRHATMVFWDFDGVVKDSLEAKAIAFERLFLPYGRDVAARVRKHHEANGGVSRFDKIPLYLGWAGESPNDSRVCEFCERFSELAVHAVIDSPWVPGVQEYLVANHALQYFVLVSATPQDEIQHILQALDIAYCFHEVHGAPRKKAAAIGDVLRRLQLNPSLAVMVGDADTDFVAAQNNGINFLLRRTPYNEALQAWYAGPTFENLAHE